MISESEANQTPTLDLHEVFNAGTFAIITKLAIVNSDAGSSMY